MSKFNNLNINGLEAICRRFGEAGEPSFGGSFRKLLKVAYHLREASNDLMYSDLNARMAA
ncbi:hypothetical protein [Proteiniphilum saccharofermentans]|uniref:hypothetical protein n=1 Tax=Proteiniphilum saccharofermentans TaxID=1642647 RepID=UPI0009783527|nr:hypothetical protein [Proteiniphilum saccharofermentans]